MAGLLVAVASAGPLRAADGAGGGQGNVGADATAVLNLTNGEVVSLHVGAEVGRPLAIIVPIEGRSYSLDLQPESVRGEGYEVLAEIAPGVYHTIEPPPVRTLRGVVNGVAGSVVAASLGDEGLHARINFPDGRVYWMEPIGSRVATAQSGDHIVYRGDDVVARDGACVELHPPVGVGADSKSGGSAGGLEAGGLYFTELALDIDFEYLQGFQGEADPIAAVIESVESIINAVNAPQYETEVDIRHVITTIIIREFEPDPYPRLCSGGSNNNEPCDSEGDCPAGSCPLVDAQALLFQFRDQWLTGHADVVRDVAHLFTGKDLAGSTIGIAWIGQICMGFGYSVVQPGCCGNFACKSDLSAHELGHNWGAEHISCSTCTMNPSLRCANTFSQTSIDSITHHRDTRPVSCLDFGDELSRLIVTATSTNVVEGGSVQFSATADFRFGADQDVTGEVIWTSVPPGAGSIDAAGLFTASEVDGNFCVKVTATYEFFGSVYERSKTILVEDLDVSFGVAESVPPAGAVDARQPSNPDGSFPVGIRTVDLIFNGDVCFLTRLDFSAAQVGGLLGDPGVSSISLVGDRGVRVELSRNIETRAWTSVTHDASGTGTVIGYLPGDVTGNGFVGSEDIVALVDALGSAPDPLRQESLDIDRSGRLAPSDLVRLIDLFGGATRYDSWYLSSLP